MKPSTAVISERDSELGGVVAVRRIAETGDELPEPLAIDQHDREDRAGLDRDVEQVGAMAEPVFGDQQVAGAGDRQELGDAFDDSEKDRDKELGQEALRFRGARSVPSIRGSGGASGHAHRAYAPCGDLSSKLRTTTVHKFVSEVSYLIDLIALWSNPDGTSLAPEYRTTTFFRTNPMASTNVFKMIKDNEVEFVDLRFADMLGKQHHVSFPRMPSTNPSSKTARCSTARRFPAGRASTNPTWC